MKREHKVIVKDFDKVRKDLTSLWDEARSGNWNSRRKIAKLKLYDVFYRHLHTEKNYSIIDCLMMGYGVWLKNKPYSKEVIAEKTGIPPYRTKGSRKIGLRLLGLYKNNFSKSIMNSAENIKRTAEEFVKIDKTVNSLLKNFSIEKIIRMNDEEILTIAQNYKKKKKTAAGKKERKESFSTEKHHIIKAKKATNPTRKEQILKIIREISDEEGCFLIKELRDILKKENVPSATIYVEISRMKKERVIIRVDNDIYQLKELRKAQEVEMAAKELKKVLKEIEEDFSMLSARVSNYLVESDKLVDFLKLIVKKSPSEKVKATFKKWQEIVSSQ